MTKVRSIFYALAVAVVLAILACMCVQAFPRQQLERYASIHPNVTMAPLRGFSADSIVNTGDAQVLDRLPGVGEVISLRMIEMRETLGGFRLAEDLLLVKGIGEKTLERIIDSLQEPLVALLETQE